MKIETKTLKAALDNIRPVISKRNTLPILSCVKLHSECGKLSVSASNLDEHIVEIVEADGEIETACVSFEYFYMSLIGKNVEIKQAKNSLQIVCGENQTTIPVLMAEEFPASPRFDNPQNHGVACAELASMVGQVAWAVYAEADRMILKSVLIESSAKCLSAVATNSRELAIASGAAIGSEFEIICPSDFVSNFTRALSRSGARLSSTESQVKVLHDGGEYYCKQLEGRFPNYKGVIPDTKNKLGSVSIGEIKELVAGCVGFKSESDAKGIFQFSPKGLTIQFEGDNGSNLTRKMDGKFASLTIALSTKKMLKVLQNIKSDEAELFFVDEKRPITIEAGELSVITMPMRAA